MIIQGLWKWCLSCRLVAIVALANINRGHQALGRCRAISHDGDALNDPLALKVVDDKVLGASVIQIQTVPGFQL